MKKINKIISLAVVCAVSVSLFGACSNDTADTTGGNAEAQSNEAKSEELPLLKIGICPGPYEDLFRDAIAPSLNELGYEIEYIQFSEYIQPNKALAEGEINVNLFQHTIFFENFVETHGLDLVSLTKVPTASMGIFSNTVSSLEELPDGALVAIANDDTNLSRSIRVLEQAGVITIDPSIDPTTATQYTISENPKNIEFIEVEAAQLPRTLESVDLAMIPGNYAISAGLDLSEAVYNETLLDGYHNIVAVRAEDADSQFAKDIYNAVHSDAFRSVIESPDYAYTSFQKPEGYED